jgi:hypothetical protein
MLRHQLVERGPSLPPGSLPGYRRRRSPNRSRTKRLGESSAALRDFKYSTRSPLCVGFVLSCRTFSLIGGLPSPLSANLWPSLFEWFIGTIPPCDSSETYARTVRLLPSPADLLPGLTTGAAEVSRFVHEVSRRALGSSTTPDQARACAIVPAHVAFRHNKSVGVRITSFRSSIPTPPIPTVYASPCTSRCPAQN